MNVALATSAGRALSTARERCIESAPLLAAGVLACLLCADATSMLWHGLRNRSAAALSTVAVPRIANRASSGQQLHSILSANLFGVAPGAEQPVAVADDNMKLAGVFAYQDPASGFAMLGAKDGGEVTVVRAGSNMPDGALLREVWVDHVVIERGGQLLTVSLERQDRPLADAPLLMPVVAEASAAVPVASDYVEPAKGSLVAYYTPKGVPPGLTYASRLAMEAEERDLHPPPPPPSRPVSLPPDQLPPDQQP